MHCLLLVFVTYLLSESSGTLAPFIKPCKDTDNECLKTSAQIAVPYLVSGIPELNVPPGEPLIINDVNADQGDLKLSLKEMKIVGTGKSKILDLTRDVKKSTMTMHIELPVLITGTYIMDGQLLFTPATGNGDFEIKSDKIRVTITIKYKTITGNGGAQHWKITGYDYSYDLVERVYIQLDNLFGGDKTKSKPVLDILNDSWKELITEIGAPIIKEIISKAMDTTKKFFLAVPTAELELA